MSRSRGRRFVSEFATSDSSNHYSIYLRNRRGTRSRCRNFGRLNCLCRYFLIFSFPRPHVKNFIVRHKKGEHSNDSETSSGTLPGREPSSFRSNSGIPSYRTRALPLQDRTERGTSRTPGYTGRLPGDPPLFVLPSFSIVTKGPERLSTP